MHPFIKVLYEGRMYYTYFLFLFSWPSYSSNNDHQSTERNAKNWQQQHSHSVEFWPNTIPAGETQVLELPGLAGRW